MNHPNLLNDALDYPKALAEWSKGRAVDMPPGEAELNGWPLYMLPDTKEALDKTRGNHPQWKAALIGRKGLPMEIDKSQWTVDCAIRDLESVSDDPFMMTVSLEPPHAPYAAQDPFYGSIDPDDVNLPENTACPDRYDRKRWVGMMQYDCMSDRALREYIRCYCAQVSMIDSQVGRLISKLEEIGRLDRTLIVGISWARTARWANAPPFSTTRRSACL